APRSTVLRVSKVHPAPPSGVSVPLRCRDGCALLGVKALGDPRRLGLSLGSGAPGDSRAGWSRPTTDIGLLRQHLGFPDTDRERVGGEVELNGSGLAAAAPLDDPVTGRGYLVRT